MGLQNLGLHLETYDTYQIFQSTNTLVEAQKADPNETSLGRVDFEAAPIEENIFIN